MPRWRPRHGALLAAGDNAGMHFALGRVPADVGAAAIRTPTGPLFDVVLLLHVACVVVGLVTVVVSAAAARRCRLSAGDPPEPVRRYFSGGTNWAGRVLYGVPVFGFALLGLSGGRYALSDGWVATGLLLWAVGAVAAEGLLWPAEQRIAGLLATPDAGDRAGPDGAAGTVPPPTTAAALGRASRETSLAAGVVMAVLLVGTVLMVAKP